MTYTEAFDLLDSATMRCLRLVDSGKGYDRQVGDWMSQCDNLRFWGLKQEIAAYATLLNANCEAYE